MTSLKPTENGVKLVIYD